jgi:ribosomal protein L40E
MIERARPLATTAGKDALRYAREHEEEIKRTALKGARLHMRGPFGYVVGALADAATRGAEQPASVLCSSCDAENPGGAKFCNQCGARLSTKPSD